jgi:hypothetical protein
MIRNLLLPATLVLFSCVSASAQCTPDVSCIPSGQTYGICPDSATGLAIGTVGVPYSQVVSMKVPADGSDFGQPSAMITSIDITSVDSLAPGLSYTCSPPSCSFPGNSNGCILITGTPTTVWNKQIIVNADAHATIFGFPATLPQENKQYRSIVQAPASVNDLDMSTFDVGQNSPNPFTGKTEIRFSSTENTEIEFKVFNTIGALVFSQTYKAEKGLNTIIIQDNSFAPGAYLYSVKNGSRTITKRMIVAK